LSPQQDVKLHGAALDATELAAWRGFLRTHARMIRELSADLERAHGMPLSSYEVLLVLANAPDERMRMAELAESVLLSPSGITRLVDRLVNDGLVEKSRCVADRRGWYAVLSDRGRDRLDEARVTHIAGVKARFHDHVTPDEQLVLAAVWERLLTGAEDDAAPACG
jgi:DNA-binding MarR family transcriptional regulator